MGKESENFYQELKRSQKGQAHTNTRKLYQDISTGTAVFLNQKRVNVCEHTTKTASLERTLPISLEDITYIDTGCESLNQYKNNNRMPFQQNLILKQLLQGFQKSCYSV